jgi:hypothetical protein
MIEINTIKPKNFFVSFVCILLILVLFSCKKNEEIEIPNNTAPPDHTISNLIIENYINRVYISVAGRKADSSEFNTAFDLLKRNNLSMTDRSLFIDSVFMKEQYKDHNYDLIRIDILDGLDTNDINERIFLFELLLTDTTYQFIWDLLKIELVRLDSMRIAPARYQQNYINIIEMHKRCVDNYFYDQLNMGSANFVVSIFQYFLNRYPTQQELDDAIRMVDGSNSILFLQNGSSKNDFLSIFFNSPDYYEGQVTNLYQRYLFRKPTSAELFEGTTSYQDDHNYESLQKKILTTNEYIGIN